MKLQGRLRNISINASNNIKSRVKTDMGLSGVSNDQATAVNPIGGKSNSRAGIREFQPDQDLIDNILQR